jgi:hypothetical protein
MNKLIILLFLFSAVASYSQTDKYGKEISLKDKTPISKILAQPEEFVGKTVLVEGEVLDVCAMAGCWMELKSDAENQKVKIKVKDGDIVFPVEAKGKTALVEGTVYKIELTKEEAVEYYEHVAEEQGNEFDAASVTGAITIYQIKGIGAKIK